jgi:hypothetical protein
MRKAAVGILAVAVILCGCGGNEQRVVELERANTGLKNDVRALQTRLDEQAGILDDLIAAAVKDQVAAELKSKGLGKLDKQLVDKLTGMISTTLDTVAADKLDEMIATRIEDQFGTAEDMSSILEKIFDETLQERDARAEEERQEQRQQRQADRQERVARITQGRIDRAAEELSLSDEQKEKYAEAQAATRERMRESMTQMREQGSFNMPEFLNTIKEQDEENMRQILDEEQFKAYQERQERQFGWIGNAFGGNRSNRQGQ